MPGGGGSGGSSGCSACWAKQYGSGSVFYQAAADPSGDIVAFGFYDDSIDFGDGPHVASGNLDAVLAKLDPAGTAIWSRTFGAAGGAAALAWGAVAPSGVIVVSGLFQGQVDFGSGPLTSVGPNLNRVLVSFDSGGNTLWSKPLGEAEAGEDLRVATDAAGNIYITGVAVGSIDLGGGPLVSAGQEDVLVAALAPSGDHLWSNLYGGVGVDRAAVGRFDPQGNVVVVGRFTDTVDFGAFPLTSAGGEDGFVATFDTATGNVLSAFRFGGPLDDAAGDTAWDPGGDMFLTGAFTGAMDLGLGPMVSAGQSDAFIARLTPSGQALWNMRAGDAATQGAGEIVRDALGTLRVLAWFDGTIDFGTGPIQSQNVGPVYDTALVTLDTAGTVLGVGHQAPSSLYWSSLFVHATSGDPMLAGSFNGELDLGFTKLVAVTPKTEAFLARLPP